MPGTYKLDVSGTSICFGDGTEPDERTEPDEDVDEEVEARPFLRERRQSRNLDWATRRDWKDWVRVWRSLFSDVFSWLSWGWERSVILTVMDVSTL